MTTIRSVAQAAKVSVTSVSNYMNGRHSKMSSETKARIERAIEKLKYIPRPAARGLKLNRQFTVGLIVSEPAPYFRLAPFVGAVFSGLVTELSKGGYACLLQGSAQSIPPLSFISNYAHADALCVFLAGSRPQRRKFFDALTLLNKPIVAIQEHESLPGPDGALLRQDDLRGGYDLTEHLIKCGARSFLHLAPAFTWPGNTLREKGVRACLTEHSLAKRIKKLTCGFGSFAEVRAALSKWLSSNRPPDAIIANNDHIGIAVLRTLADFSFKVPSDVMVTGFNALELWHYSNPQLTTMVSPAYRLGQVAADLLLERLKTGSFSSKEIVLPVTMQIGGSTISK